MPGFRRRAGLLTALVAAVAVGTLLVDAAGPSTASATFAASPLPATTAGSARQKPDLAPFVPTPPEVVDRMLRLAGVTPRDVVYDLGCGDGRIVIAAARDFGARGVGVDIDPVRIAESKANAKAAGVSDKVTFRVENALETDVSDATVVTLYLLTASNVKLRPILTRQLKPGARIVAHAFGMGDWPPQRVENFTDSAGGARTLYLWTIGGKGQP